MAYQAVKPIRSSATRTAKKVKRAVVVATVSKRKVRAGEAAGKSSPSRKPGKRPSPENVAVEGDSSARERQNDESAVELVTVGLVEGRSECQADPSVAAMDRILAERALIDRCLSGDSKGWDLLYQRFHGPLTSIIRARLKFRRHDASLIDEIAALVWYALVANQGAILNRFDPARECRLITFLGEVVRDNMSRHFRAERRRRDRERASAVRQPAGNNALNSLATYPPAALAEFIATLTPAERSFYEDMTTSGSDLAAAEDEKKSNYSDSNRWQLRHRVHKKLVHFLGGSS